MKRPSRTLLGGFFIVLSVLLLAAAGRAEATETVRIKTTSGRTFVGRPDGSSDADHFWLRSGSASASIRRPIDWDRIETIEAEGELVSAAEFRRHMRAAEERGEKERGEPESSAPEERANEKPRTIESTGAAEADTAEKEIIDSESTAEDDLEEIFGDDLSLNRVPGAEETTDRPARVATIRLEAAAANWDADVELDGLAVRLYPLDEKGEIVPAQGTLEIDLTGERNRLPSSGEAFPRLGRWSRAVEPADVTAGGAAFHLPFQSYHPEFDARLSDSGIVHARLIVPGQGVFESSISASSLRPYSALRERYEARHGSRFLPQERTNRGRAVVPLWP